MAANCSDSVNSDIRENICWVLFMRKYILCFVEQLDKVILNLLFFFQGRPLHRVPWRGLPADGTLATTAATAAAEAAATAAPPPLAAAPDHPRVCRGGRRRVEVSFAKHSMEFHFCSPLKIWALIKYMKVLGGAEGTYCNCICIFQPEKG